MKRTLFILALIAQSLAAAAQHFDWDSVADWEQYLRNEDMDRAVKYALYDVDGDGVDEAFVTDDEYGYALLCCGSGTPVCLVSSIFNTELQIVQGHPVVTLSGSCGSGCVLEQIYKLKGSRREYMLERTVYVSPDGDEDVQCTLYTNGQSKEVTHDFFVAKTPNTNVTLTMDQLDWRPIGGSAYQKPEPKEIDPSRAVYVAMLRQSGDTIFVRDGEDYLYELYSDGTAAVASGGAYTGDVIIPPLLDLDGTLYRVTVVRRGAMWKKADAPNIGKITSVSLPETVTLVGADAFRGNASLREFTCSERTHVEVRAFWECPALEVEAFEPVYAFTTGADAESNDAKIEAHSKFYAPTDVRESYQSRFTWAFFKYNHGMLDFDGWANFDKEYSMACWCSNTNAVRSANYSLCNRNNATSMFKGYMDEECTVVLADNGYVGTHEFPAFTRWTWGEEVTPVPASYISELEKRYGRKVRESGEVGHLLYTQQKEQLVFAEFEIKNDEARYVLAWLRDGKEVCSYTQKTDIEDGEVGFSVWNVDDDGTYGIPTLLTVARDEKGRIELFLEHSAPESITYSHLKQNGKAFEEEGGDVWYVWVDCPY